MTSSQNKAGKQISRFPPHLLVEASGFGTLTNTQEDKIIKRILQFFATLVSSLSIFSALGQLPYYKNAPLMPCPTCHLRRCHARRAIALCLGQSRLLLIVKGSIALQESECIFCRKIKMPSKKNKIKIFSIISSFLLLMRLFPLAFYIPNSLLPPFCSS